MSGIGPIMVTNRQARGLVLTQSVLAFLQVIAGASALADIIGAKPFAVFVVVVAGVQAAVNTYMSKTVGEAASTVNTAVSRAETVTDRAEANTARVARVAGIMEEREDGRQAF